jgi:hypothetical protein
MLPACDVHGDVTSASQSRRSAVPRSGVLVRELDEEVLILDTVSDRIHRLNSSAAVVWRMFEDGAPEQAIVDALVTRFDVPPDVACSDVRDTILALQRLDVCARAVQTSDVDQRGG